MAANVLEPANDRIAGAYRLLPPGFAAEVTSDDGSVVFRLQGELDLATPPAGPGLGTTLNTGPSAIILDLGELTFVDSTGLAVFVAASRRSAWIGYPFILRSPRPAVRKTLRLTGVDGRITIDIEGEGLRGGDAGHRVAVGRHRARGPCKSCRSLRSLVAGRPGLRDLQVVILEPEVFSGAGSEAVCGPGGPPEG